MRQLSWLVYLHVILFGMLFPKISQAESNNFSIGVRYYSYNSESYDSKDNQIGVATIKRYSDSNALRFEYGHSSMDLDYKYSYDVPYGEQTEERKDTLSFFNILVDYYFFGHQHFLAPFLGGFIGVLELEESNIDTDYFPDNVEKYILFPFGLVFGFDFNFGDSLCLSFEARYIYNLGSPKRDIVDYISFGEAHIREERIDLFGTWVGAGLSFRF